MPAHNGSWWSVRSSAQRTSRATAGSSSSGWCAEFVELCYFPFGISPLDGPPARAATHYSATEMSVLVVGSIALDTVKTPFEEHADLLGGSASYAALGA